MGEAVVPLAGSAAGFDPLVVRAGACRVVLLGEATHGTREFYRERAEITKRLIREAGVTAVAAEADWPDAERVNRWVRGLGDDRSADEALSGFRRFPSWMWRNRDVLEFVGWLRGWNDALPAGAPRVGFYGLDLYSLQGSMAAVLEHLDREDPAAAARARERYACFDRFDRDERIYAYETGLGGAEPCEDRVVEVLTELREATARAAAREDAAAADRRFHAEQNARLVVDAEAYYRAAFRGGAEAWNLRDRHMARTLDALLAHLDGAGAPARVAVWAHNSHLGDARATELGEAGELNLGQLAREAHGARALLVGFTTHRGTVTAARDWDGPPERMRVLPALAASWEDLLHRSGAERAVVRPAGLGGSRLERAIGVVYRPETERVSHWFSARLGAQFDLVVHIDRTTALEPLEPGGAWAAAEPAEARPAAV